jgi:hypothetical protein
MIFIETKLKSAFSFQLDSPDVGIPHRMVARTRFGRCADVGRAAAQYSDSIVELDLNGLVFLVNKAGEQTCIRVSLVKEICGP